jgi:MFS family permease
MSRLRTLWNNPFTLPIYLPSLLLALGQGILVPVMPLFAASFDISYGLIGLMLSGYYLGTLLTDIPAGIILARVGTRRTLLSGLLLVSLPLGLIYFTQTVWALFIFYTLAGFGAALSNISRHRYLTEAVKSGARGRAIALFGGISRIGRFSGPAIGGFLGRRSGCGCRFYWWRGWEEWRCCWCIGFCRGGRRRP